MGAFIWTLAIAASAALIWRMSRRSDGAGAAVRVPDAAAAGPAAAPAPASGPADTPLVAAGARADGTGSQAAEEEPIDGWTLSAADTAATDPPVEEQYIEDIAVAPHAAPIDPGSEPDPWRIRRTASPAGRAAAPSRAGIPRTEGTQPAGKSPGTADRAPVPPEDVLFGAPEWAGDDGERLADPGSPEGGPGEADRPRQ